MQTLVALTSPGFAAKLLFDGPELHDSQAPLPPQTPEYLASRTQAVWDMIREKLIQARGGSWSELTTAASCSEQCSLVWWA